MTFKPIPRVVYLEHGSSMWSTQGRFGLKAPDGNLSLFLSRPVSTVVLPFLKHAYSPIISPRFAQSTGFDDVFSRNLDVLSVTFFSSLLLWVFFGALLYVTERNNPDPEMAANYNNVPNSMWMTLLNLSGEAPLAQ